MQKILNYVLSGVVLYLTVVGCGDSDTSGSSRPVITLLGESPIEVQQNVPYVDAGATAFDDDDGNITSDIDTVNSVDYLTIDTYTVTYDVVDSGGEAADQVVRTVDVVSNFSPVISMQGISPIDALLGYPYVDDGATADDTEDGDITSSILTVDSVDTSVAGTYTVTYDVTDSAGATATQVVRTVNVAGAAE